MVQTTNIPIVGDKEYLHRIAVLAKARNLRMGDIVRQAIDAQFGDALRKVDDLIKVEGGHNGHSPSA